MADISKGDRVTWNTSQGETRGKVIDRRVKHFTFDGQKFNASDDDPYVIVESEKTGKQAAHKASSVTKA
jgi:hypothetical protein